MPRGFDLYPDRRGRDDTHSPLKNLLDWTSPVAMTAQDSGNRINKGIDAKVTAAVDNTVQWIKDNTGIDLTNLVALTDLIAQELHFGDTTYWTSWFDNLTAMFQDLDFTSSSFNPTEAWNLFASTFLGPLGIVLTPASPLDASKLLGQLFPGLFSNVPSTSITAADANLLWNGGFVGAISVSGGGVWVLDQYVYKLVPGEDATTAGSVRVTADGTTKQLASNAVTVGHTQQDQILPGQDLAYSVDVLTSGLTGTGTPIRIAVQTNLSETTLAQVMPAGTDLTAWHNPPAGAKAATLTADYTVPSDGSVTWVKMILTVDASATAGSVWWDAASEKLTGGLIAELQSGFADLQTESETQMAAWQTMIASWQTTLGNGALDWPTKLAQMEAAFSTYQQVAQGVASSEVMTLSQIINGLLGIDTTTGSTPQTQVAGLDTSLAELSAAAAGDTTNAGDWAWLADIVSKFFGTATDAHDMAVNNANTLGIRTNKPLIYGLDDTTESNIAFTDATSQINVTSAATRWAFVRCQQDDIKNTVAFTANTASAPTGFYVNVYLVDFVNSNTRFITQSTNLVSLLSSTEAWIFVDAAGTAVDPGTVIAVEFQVVGSGSVNIYGKTGSTTKPIHPAAQLQGVAATRTTTPGGATTSVGFTGQTAPSGVAVDSAGAVYVTDTSNGHVSKRAGSTQTLLGFSGLTTPADVAVNAAGVVYVTDTTRVVKLVGSTQSNVLTGLSDARGIAVGSDGAIYVADRTANHVIKYADGVQTTLPFTGLNHPMGVAVDADGAVYVADEGNNRVVKLAGTTQTVLLTGLSAPQGVAVDWSGAVYVADHGNNRTTKLAAGTTTLATMTLSGPQYIAADPNSGAIFGTGTSNTDAHKYTADTPFSALTFTQGGIPYVGLETSAPPPPVYPDHQVAYPTPGTWTQTLDPWVSTFDIVLVGQGGGGQGETGSTVGRGGSPGVWAARTLVVGTDIAPGGTVTLSIHANPSSRGIVAPGSGGPYFADGQAGAATVASWVDPTGTPQTLSAAGGAGGGIGNPSNLTTYGESPGNETFNGYTYIGGGAALVPEDGLPPGGSGPGGQPFQYGFNGARGQAWTVEHQ